MDILFVAIPIALLVAGFFVAAFLWGVRSGQWDDVDTPPMRMLLEDETETKNRADKDKNAP